MTLATKLGKSFEAVKENIKTRTIHIDLEGVKFDLKVRVPLKKEIEEITQRIVAPPKEKVDAIFNNLAAPILKTLDEGGEGFEKALNAENNMITRTEDDLIVQGNSVRNIAQFSAIERQRVEEYFALLVSETGEAVNETYDQIVAEFPEFVVKEITQAIDSAIKPDYKTVKKN